MFYLQIYLLRDNNLSKSSTSYKKTQKKRYNLLFIQYTYSTVRVHVHDDFEVKEKMRTMQ